MLVTAMYVQVEGNSMVQWCLIRCDVTPTAICRLYDKSQKRIACKARPFSTYRADRVVTHGRHLRRGVVHSSTMDSSYSSRTKLTVVALCFRLIANHTRTDVYLVHATRSHKTDPLVRLSVDVTFKEASERTRKR